MKAVLLCAGYATRLYPLTQNQPKPLLPVGGRPLLEYLLEKIERLSSVDKVFLTTNDRFYPHFKAWARAKRYPWKIEVVNDGTSSNESRLGAIGDLAFVIRKHKIEDDLGVFAGDNLFLSELDGFLSFAESHRPHTSLAVVDVKKRELATRYGIVLADASHRVSKFLEKPADPPATTASTGVYWLAKEGLNLLDRYIREGHNADRPGDYIHWLVEVDRVFAYPLTGKWVDIGDPDSYRKADRMMLKLKRPSRKEKGHS